jgi:hypothetical protein
VAARWKQICPPERPADQRDLAQIQRPEHHFQILGKPSHAVAADRLVRAPGAPQVDADDAMGRAQLADLVVPHLVAQPEARYQDNRPPATDVLDVDADARLDLDLRHPQRR